jgi:hypothetical protein
MHLYVSILHKLVFVWTKFTLQTFFLKCRILEFKCPAKLENSGWHNIRLAFKPIRIYKTLEGSCIQRDLYYHSMI